MNCIITVWKREKEYTRETDELKRENKVRGMHPTLAYTIFEGDQVTINLAQIIRGDTCQKKVCIF
jgi:hypothetical protein